MKEWVIIQDAKEEGREEGRQEGREEGRQEGREEGRQEGRNENAYEVYMRCLARGMNDEEAKEISGYQSTANV